MCKSLRWKLGHTNLFRAELLKMSSSVRFSSGQFLEGSLGLRSMSGLSISVHFPGNWDPWTEKLELIFGKYLIILLQQQYFLLHPHENQSKLLGYKSRILMITLVYSTTVSVRNNLLHSVRHHDASFIKLLNSKKSTTM